MFGLFISLQRIFQVREGGAIIYLSSLNTFNNSITMQLYVIKPKQKLEL